MKFNNGLEIGASDAKGSFILQNYSFFINGTLIEPNIILFKDLIKKTMAQTNIKIKNFAVSNFSGSEDLYHIGRSSFLKNSDSFINLMSKSPWEGSKPEYYLSKLAKPVKVVDIKSFELEKFDFISLSCNGSELNILKDIKYLPVFLRCTFNYQNEHQVQYSQKIFNILNKYNYKVINIIKNETQTFSDIIFQKI